MKTPHNISINQYKIRQFLHDFSCKKGPLIIKPEDASWFEDVVAEFDGSDVDAKALKTMLEFLRKGESLEVCFDA